MSDTELLKTPLHDLHVELGARMVPFAGYSMPVQYPTGLIAEHRHTREAAGLFDVSHMGQIKLVGADAAAALESLMPVDVMSLGVDRQRYGLLLTDAGTIVDDLMFVNWGDPAQATGESRPRAAGEREGPQLFLIVNGACKANDIELLQNRIGQRCQVLPMPERALLALQGPKAVDALQRLVPGVEQLVFMTGGAFSWNGTDLYVTRSGYTGEDGFEISIHGSQAEAFARELLALPEVKPVGLGARNSLRLEAGLCLYGNDIDTSTTPVEAGLNWAIQKVRRSGGERAGGFAGADKVLPFMPDAAGHPAAQKLSRKRVALIARERVPVREHVELQDAQGRKIGATTSGLIGPSIDQPIAMGYVTPEHAAVGTPVFALVRGKPVPMEVAAAPFVPTRYHRA